MRGYSAIAFAVIEVSGTSPKKRFSVMNRSSSNSTVRVDQCRRLLSM